MSPEIPLTIIIADYSQQDSIADCLGNLNSWFPPMIIVSNNSHLNDQLRDDFTSTFVLHKSNSIYQLWKRGITESKTHWNLLITSNEIVTGQLKKSVENQIKNISTTKKLYKFKKKVIFLKKVLKYPLEWPAEFPSSLIFISHIGNLPFGPGPYHSSPYLPGEVVHFSTPTLADSIQEIARLAEIEADKVFQESGSQNLTTLIIKTFWKSGYEFFKSLVLKKGFRERYEGVVFSMLGGVIPPLGLLRYFEKYSRGGRKIAKNLTSIHNVLVIKIGGAGDLLLATPILRNLKKLLPNVQIHVLAVSDRSSLLENNPYIDSLSHIGFDANQQTINRISRGFKSSNIDLAINLQSTKFSSKILKQVPARWKINRSYYFRDKNTDVLVGVTNTFRSVIERDLDILRSIGLKPADKYTEVFLTAKEIDWAKRFFNENGLSQKKRTVVVHPCSSIKIRNWGIEKFALLCRNLIVEDDAQIIINCSPQEIDSIAPLKILAPEVCVFSGSLRELLGLINESDLLIGNDSGPTHCSVALNVPTITLNGPSTSSFFRDPDLIRNPHFTFNKDVPCRDLFHTQCMSKIDPVTNHPRCDEMICLEFSVDEVIAKVRELLKIKHFEAPTP
jgi:ADP-heptose:LPS heptosyltransferase